MVLGTILAALEKNWWILLLRGILAILFGLFAFARPGLTAVTLILLYAIYALVDGIFAIWAGGTAKAWGLLLSGVGSLIFGIYAFFFPGVATLALLYIIGFWLILRGIFEIVSAMQIRKEIENEWMLILGGLFSILAGVAICLRPGAGLVGIVWIIAGYAVVYGIIMIILAFRLKRFAARIRGAISNT
jgi:uncharacterized membrane protein HdeD (DUF308 family)